LKCLTRGNIINTRALPSRPEPSGNNKPEDFEENSLLNSNNSVKGVIILPLTDAFRAESLQNEAAVYAIRCKHNNMHYIGESKNIKNRIPQHKEHLKNESSNTRFLNDFKKYGPEGFECIIVKKGGLMDNFEDRLDLQGQLQSLLIPKNLCYNTGTSETLTPRPTGEFPTSPGLYCIRCKVSLLFW
jgi:hypothetical protein